MTKIQLRNIWLHISGTLIHKMWVFAFMVQFATKLIWRGVVHDNSKLGLHEFKGFARKIHRLKDSTYGSDEYQKMLSEKDFQEALSHHYRVNSHHPEYYQNILSAMDLFDAVEMLSDWRAAVKRRKDGCIYRSFMRNEERFKIDNQFMGLLKNTIRNSTHG